MIPKISDAQREVHRLEVERRNRQAIAALDELTAAQREASRREVERRRREAIAALDEYVEQRSARDHGNTCRLCHRTPVGDTEWRTTCELLDLTYQADSGMRTCAPCIRRTRELERASRSLAEKPRPAQPARPPLGLRLGV